MDFKLGNVLLGGFISVLIINIFDYLFYGKFSIRSIVISIVTVLIVFLIFLFFQNQKKKRD